MQKTKNINKIITIIFFIYLFISIIINSIKIYQEFSAELGINFSKQEWKNNYREEYSNLSDKEKEEYGLKPFEEISDEEFESMIQKNILFNLLIILMIGMTITVFENGLFIIILIVINVMNKKFLKEKLNKDDFDRSKEYYRDILQGYGICELSWIDDFKIEMEKDIIGEILLLEKNNVITMTQERIVVNENYDKTKLKNSQLYILEHIKDGKLIGITESELVKAIKEDAIKDNIVEERDELKKRQIKRILKSIILFVALYICINPIFDIVNGIYIENVIVVFVIFMMLILLMIGFVCYPIICIVSFIAYSTRYKLDPYFRTEKGNELNKRIEGLKKYLKDYTLLDSKEKEEIVIWEEYLIYSVLFDQNKNVIKEYKTYINY